MCVFHSFMIPLPYEKNSVKQLFHSQGFNWHKIDVPSILEKIGEDVDIIYTAKECDCGSYIGSKMTNPELAEMFPEKEINKKRRKGWSEQKIENWKSNRRKKLNELNHQTVEMMEESLRKYESIFRSLKESSLIDWIGFLIYEYSSQISGEEVKIKGQNEIMIKEIDREYLLNMEQDIIYRIKIK